MRLPASNAVAPDRIGKSSLNLIQTRLTNGSEGIELLVAWEFPCNLIEEKTRRALQFIVVAAAAGAAAAAAATAAAIYIYIKADI